MNVALHKPWTPEQFLQWEEQRPLRYEFDGVAPCAMIGGTRAHADIQANLAAALRPRLKGGPCQFYGNDLKFQVASGNVRYPDGMVVCSPVERAATVVRDPVIVFEVLSPSTARTDRLVKALEYQATASVQRYVMLEQDCVGATVFIRRGRDWTHELLVADAVLALPELGLELPFAELYEGIEFEADPPNTLDAEPER